MVLLCSVPLLSQAQQPFRDYRKEAQDHSAIYTGKTAYSYSKQKFANNPYWETEEYRNGTLSYEGRLYTDVPLRYDLFQNNLNILSPKRVGINVDMRKVDYFTLNDVLFVPDGDSYRLILHDSEHFKLTSVVGCHLGQDEVKGTVSFRSFRITDSYTLTIDGTAYDVKKRNSFIKRFPAYKKQLKKYAKENELDFSAKARRQSLSALAKYAESLIKANHHAK